MRPVFLIALLVANSLFAQTVEWAVTTQDPTNQSRCHSFGIDLDSDGNVYVCGDFRYTVDFDPGPGNYSLVNNTTDDVGFLKKMDADGNFLAAIPLGFENTYDVFVDDNHNVYIWGDFDGTKDFDPDSNSVFNLTAVGTYGDPALLKLDSAWNFVWARTLVDFSARDIALDNQGNLVMTGFFSGTRDFDPGPGTFFLTTATSSASYISKLDGDWSFLNAWMVSDGTGTYGAGITNSLAVSSSNEILVTGNYSDSTDFDPSPGTDIHYSFGGSNDAFVQKWDGAGNLQWTVSYGRNQSEIGYEIFNTYF